MQLYSLRIVEKMSTLPTDLHGLRSNFSEAVGATLKAARLVGYVRGGEVHRDNVMLELQLDTGKTFLLFPAKDGESLRIENEPWQDPVADSDDEATSVFVEQYGQWLPLALDSQNPLSINVGQPISDYEPIANEHGKIVGVLLRTALGCFTYVVEWDEGHISPECNAATLQDAGYQLGWPQTG